MGVNNARSPVVIIGMHRSGTTMITRLLEKIGLFVGKNHEPLFFANLNNWIMRQCAAEWDAPTGCHVLDALPDVRKLLVDRAGCYLKSPRSVFFMGLGNYYRYRTPLKLPMHWGWKDPRNTFTLPIWLSIFPDAKIIHVFRHGVDVAQSLKVRAERYLAIEREKICNGWMRPRLASVSNTLHCLSLEGGFGLWCQYMDEAKFQLRDVKNESMSIKYEDFLADPLTGLSRLNEFCDLAASTEKVRDAAALVRKERAYSYKNDEVLAQFAQSNQEELNKRGY